MQYRDLAVTFDNLMANQEADEAASSLSAELLLFYRVKDLQQYNFEGATVSNAISTTANEEASTGANEASQNKAVDLTANRSQLMRSDQ